MRISDKICGPLLHRSPNFRSAKAAIIYCPSSPHSSRMLQRSNTVRPKATGATGMLHVCTILNALKSRVWGGEGEGGGVKVHCVSCSEVFFVTD